MKRKWTLFWFWTGDFKAVERYLNEQAAKGWELEEAGVFAQWKRTERTDLTYCVDLANPKDEKKEHRREAYLHLCAEGGWELVDLVNQMYIFKSMPGREAIPIQTDPEMEWKNYKPYFLKRTLLIVFLTLISVTVSGLNLIRLRWAMAELQWMVGILLALGFLVMAWRVADLIRTMISSRTGEIAVSPRWVMWINCAMLVVAVAVVALGVAIIVMLPFSA